MGYDYSPGKKYNMLTILKDDNKRKHFVVCKCDCGNIKSIYKYHLTSKSPTVSCGCYLKAHAKSMGDKYFYDNTKKFNEDCSKYKTNLGVVLKNKPYKNNTSGVTGISKNKRKNKWEAYISIRGKFIHLGLYANKLEAINARKEAELKYHIPIIDAYKKEKNEKHNSR